MSRIRRSDEEYDREMRAFKAGSRLAPPGRTRMPTHEERIKQNRMKRKERLTYHEGKFIEGMSKGMTQKDAALFAGYAISGASVQASRLMQKDKIIKELDKVGLTDAMLAQNIKTNIEAGTGIKATADTALKGVELALKLKGHLQSEPKGDTTNVQINDLRNLSDEDLIKRMEMLQAEPLEGEIIE